MVGLTLKEIGLWVLPALLTFCAVTAPPGPEGLTEAWRNEAAVSASAVTGRNPLELLQVKE